MDPRESVISHRLCQVKKIIVVASGKGGVGKSIVASTLALVLKQQGKQVGLLDLDMYGPSAHVILDVDPHQFPEEENGVLPFDVHGLKFMSTVYFTKDKPSAFRGLDITNIIVEMLAITRWDELDVLVVDMPPGLGDEMLDVLRLLPSPQFLVVTTSSKVSYVAVEKLLKLCTEINVPLIGVLENMAEPLSTYIEEKIENIHLPHLGKINIDHHLEASLGNPEKLLNTTFASELKQNLSFLSSK